MIQSPYVRKVWGHCPRVFRTNKITRVTNLGWLIRHAYKVPILEFRICKAKYSTNWDLYVIVKFADNTVYATRYADRRVCQWWLAKSRTLPNFENCTLVHF